MGHEATAICMALKFFAEAKNVCEVLTAYQLAFFAC